MDSIKKTAATFNGVPEEVLANTILDRDNPTSLINMVPDRLVPILLRVREKLPTLIFQSEACVKHKVKPDERDERLRLAFWDEYSTSTALKKRMSIQTILASVTNWEVWVNHYETDDLKMAWIMTPPRSYAQSMKYILHLGTERLLEIMSLPIVNAQGNVDSKVITQILKAFQLADMRVKGGIVQRVQIDQRSLNVHTGIGTEDGVNQQKQLEGLSLDELEKLERRITKAQRARDKEIAALPEAQQLEVLDIQANEEFEPLRARIDPLPSDESVPAVRMRYE